MPATPTARIVKVEPGPAGFVVVTIVCPLCGRRHEHGTRSKGLGPTKTRRRAASCGPDDAVTDVARARGYRLHDPDDLVLDQAEAVIRGG